MYEEIILNCFRFLGFKSLYDIEVLSLREYSLRMKSYQLQRIDKENEMHMQAWLNNMAGATKEQGKKQVPVFKSYKDFFDYEKRLEEVSVPKEPKLSNEAKRMAKIAFLVNSGKEVTNG